jgi:hypothetical protein
MQFLRFPTKYARMRPKLPRFWVWKRLCRQKLALFGNIYPRFVAKSLKSWYVHLTVSRNIPSSCVGFPKQLKNPQSWKGSGLSIPPFSFSWLTTASQSALPSSTTRPIVLRFSFRYVRHLLYLNNIALL